MIPTRFEFEVGHCNGTMSVDILHKNGRLFYADFTDDIFIVDVDIDWPDTLRMYLSGKNLSKDTKIDQSGNILSNKYIKLRAVRVLNMDLTEAAMYRICNFFPQDGQEISEEIFWDRNGYAEIKFNQKNPMRWNFYINNILNFRNAK
jgi:hypothetical protein